MATGSRVYQIGTCSRISHITVLVFSLELLLLSQNVQTYPVDLSSDSGSADSYGGDFYWTTIMIPVVFLVSIVFFTFMCTGGCCQVNKINWFGRRRVVEVPMGFSNPVADAGMMSISEIDVRALELDPIVFEPLPTINDLTPVSGNAGRFHGDRNRDSFDLRSQISPIVPFSANDANVYAHDWFDEPYRNFPRGNIEYIKEVGKGWFGQVIEAEARDIVPFSRKIRVLVKVLREDATGVEQMRFLDESRWYRDSNHGNILKLLGHSIETLPFLLIMEHCPQGDLKSFLIANVTRAELLNNEGAIVRMSLDIARGLEWMTSADFIHADLAARNCQVGSEGRILIGDCGLATQTFRDDYYWSSNIAIPLRWTAPETLHCTINTIQTLKVTKMSNVWTFGILLWEICEFGKLPYFELNDDEVISRAIIEKNYTLGQPTMPCLAVKEQLFEIMKSCWNSSPDARPPIALIVKELEAIYKIVTAQPVVSPAEEFDSKWEQLGKTPNSTDREKGKKKNVSFMGFQEEGELEFEASPNDFLNGVLSKVVVDTPETTEMDMSLSFPTADQSISPHVMEMESDPSNWKVEPMSLTDPDEELYNKRIERGDISQKVREKSQSVQDLMVLTHVEASELSDPDSFIMISKQQSPSQFQQTAMGVSSTASSNVATNGTASNSVRKSSSETALTSLSAAANTNSSQWNTLSSSSVASANSSAKVNSSVSTNSVLYSSDGKPSSSLNLSNSNICETNSNSDAANVNSSVIPSSSTSNSNTANVNSSSIPSACATISNSTASNEDSNIIPSSPATLNSNFSSENRNMVKPSLLGAETIGSFDKNSITPQDKSIQIKVTEATPVVPATPVILQNGSHKKERGETKKRSGIPPNPTRLKFIVDSGGKLPQHTRHTSTPIRTPSPNVEVDETADTSDVFYSISPAKSNNSTWNISPISKHANSSIEIDGFTSLVMGASDDLGLKPYQKVTTELNESSNSAEFFHETATDIEDKNEGVVVEKVFQNQAPKVNFKLGVLDNKADARNHNPQVVSPLNHSFSKVPVPRVLFPSDGSLEPDDILDLPESPNSSLKPFSSLLHSKDNLVKENTNNDHTNGGHTTDISPSINQINLASSKYALPNKGPTSQGSGELADISSSINPNNNASRVNSLYDFTLSSDLEEKPSKNYSKIISHSQESQSVDDFWTKQVLGFQEAAGTTRSLLNSENMADLSTRINPNNISSHINTLHDTTLGGDLELTANEKETDSIMTTESQDADDFWAKQMQGFQEATGNTRALFQLSLGHDGENEIASKDKFVEDIEAATEELGSLVMHDLEDNTSVSEIVKETREESEVGPAIRSKIAFDGVIEPEDDYPAEWEENANENTEVTILENKGFGSLAKKIKMKNSVPADPSSTASGSSSKKDNEYEESSEIEDDTEDICKDFVPSKWNQNLAPTKPAIKSPEQQLQPTEQKSNLRKSVSFERKKPQLVYEYPPPPPTDDSDDDDKVHFAASLPMALSSSLDWELTQEELEDSEIHQHDDWGEDDVIAKAENPMDVYRISGFGDEQFHVRGSSEPFVFSPSTLGELRHTRDRLKLDLSRGEASILDDETKGAAKLDSGVGSSTNVSPFNHCDNQA